MFMETGMGGVGIPMIASTGNGNGGNGNNGGFGDNGIWAILLLALLGNGMWGGNNCGNNGSGGGSDLATMALLGGGGGGGGTTALGRELDFVNANVNSRFDSLENMNEFRHMTQANNIQHVEAMEAQRDTFNELCSTRSAMVDQSHQAALISKDTQRDMALGFKDVAMQQADCCCTTNRSIDAVRYEAAQNTAAIISASKDNTQRILDRMCADEKQALRDKIDELRLAVPRPAYITNAPGQSLYPPYNMAMGGCC